MAELKPAGGGAALELAAFDPTGMDLAADPASARVELVARGALDLVVRSRGGAGRYALDVRALPLADEIARAGWVGTLSAGETLRLAAREARTFELTTAEALSLAVAPESGAARVLDLAEVPPRELARALPGAPATVELGALHRIAIACDDGTALEVSGAASALLGIARRARPAPLARERARWGLAASEPAYGAATESLSAGEVLVQPRAGLALAAELELSADLERRGLARIDRVGADVLQVRRADVDALAPAEAARATLALVRALEASPRVLRAEPNRVRHLQAQGAPTFLPDDTHFGKQWHYPQIRLPEAWAELQDHALGTALEDVVVAVLDTGRRPHPDLDANTRADIEFDFISSASSSGDTDGADPSAFDNGDSPDIGTSSFHGMHVAGTIAALTDNALGVSGAASVEAGSPSVVPHVKIVHMRVVGREGATDADVARAIRYCAGLPQTNLPLLTTPVDVINMSIGGPGTSFTLQDAINAARNRGVTLFAAAGNGNSGTPFFPAAASNVISVAAVDINSNKASYSNFHPSVDLCAPGGDTSVDRDGDGFVDGVLSTLVNEDDGAPTYAYYQGTSMACPHAAAVAALMKSVRRTQTPAEIESKMKEAAADLGAAGPDSTFGAGLVDALRSVRLAGTSAPGAAELGVTPPELYFGPLESQLSIALFNLGGGTIQVTAPTISVPWLVVGSIGAPAGSDVNVSSLRVQVNRAHPALAADGQYEGTVTVNSNAGSVPVPVSVIVGTPPLPSVTLFVLALAEEDGKLVAKAQTTIDPSVSLDFALDELTTADGLPLPPGDYLVACGSDDDLDMTICGPGDVYCGVYRTIDDPTPVRVNGDRENIDFTVASSGSFVITASGGVAGRKLPLLRPR